MTSLATNKSSVRVLLLLPYFGKWPEYIDLYFRGCEFNKWMDILFITDCPIPQVYPSNVTFIKSNLLILSELISEKLGLVSYKLPSAYKLCDLRPCYGYLFDNYIEGYDYWGYGDIDLIYGNLWEKIKQPVDQNFDTISARAENTSGSFMLLKNNNYNNQLFKKIEKFNDLILSNNYEGIDETNHNWAIWNGMPKCNLSKSCFTYLVDNEHNQGKIKASFQTFICEHLAPSDIIKYSDGEVHFKNKSYAYFHYVTNKSSSYFSYPKWLIIPDTFYISETGFYKTMWTANLIGPLKKYFYLGIYYTRKATALLFKVLKK